jgi:prolipoprotein diacylglyceryltransferase
VPIEQNLWLIVACVFGALIGSKLLAWLESWPDYWAHRADVPAILGGKTIVGGLLGGWIGVEIAKKLMRITARTGDLFVFPLIIGIAIGRVGCFLTGLPDHTYGIATTLPWGVDFGDGVRRHPTQLYEIAFVLMFGAALATRAIAPRPLAVSQSDAPPTAKPQAAIARSARQPGSLFRLFMVAYLSFRFAVEFIKPRYTIPHLGLSAIQLASLAGAIAALVGIARPRPPNRAKEELLATADA